MATIAHGGDVFAVARSRGWDWREVLDFSANINPLGPPEGVRGAICRAIDRVVHYPERESTALRQSLAAKWEVAPEQILTGNGATELIFFMARALSPKHVTLAVPVFSEFHRAFPEARNVSLENAAAWGQEGLLVVTRPANPTGWSFPLEALELRLATSAKAVMVDESFIEFSALPSALSLLSRYPQLIVLRSLTKFYALPGLRVGAVVSSVQNIGRWRELREPWQVNVLAEEAALAALTDSEHAARSREFVETERRWMLNHLRGLPGAKAFESDANFIYVRISYPARKLYEHLLKRKILIRDCACWPGVSGESVRVAVRTRRENEALIAAWSEF